MGEQSCENLEKDWLKEFPARVDEVFNDDTEMVWDEWKKKKAYILSGDEETKHPGLSFLGHLLPHPAIWIFLLTLAGGVAWGLLTIFQLIHESIPHQQRGGWYYDVFKPLVSFGNPGALLILVLFGSAEFGLLFLLSWVQERMVRFMGERFKEVKDRENGNIKRNKRQTASLVFWIIVACFAAIASGVVFGMVYEIQKSMDVVLRFLVSLFFALLLFFAALYPSVFHIWALLFCAKTLRKKRVFVWGVSIVSFILSIVLAGSLKKLVLFLYAGPDFWVGLSFVIAVVISLIQYAWYYFGIRSAYLEWEEDAKKNKKRVTGFCSVSLYLFSNKNLVNVTSEIPESRKSGYSWFKSEAGWRIFAWIVLLILLFVALPLLVVDGLLPVILKNLECIS